MVHSVIGAVPLLGLPAGTKCTLVKWGKLPLADIKHLNEVGIVLGMPLQVQEDTISGPVVIVFNDAHLAIGRDAAKELLVLVEKE